MLFDEADSELLKQWIVKKLEDVSDADSDVLADYVLALVKTDDPEPVAKASCVENLQDFLGDTSQKFVDDVFTAIKTRAYDPSKPAPKAPAPTYQPPRRTSIDPPQQQSGSRKRGYHDWDRDESQNGQIQSYQGGDRPLKQPRRGRGGRGGGGFDQRGGRQNQFGGVPQAQLPQMPTPPPGIPAFDPNNPLGSMMAQFAAMTGMPGFPQQPPQKERCRDYDNLGFCARGAQCPFEHGNDHFVVPPTNDQYDPNQATLFNVQPTRTGTVQTSPGRRGRGGQRGRGGGGNSRGGGRRAEFSMVGQNDDRSITAVVVEQIPEDKFDEQTVRDFFSEFGNIEEVTMQPYKRLAIVRFDSYDAARAAYDSPKVIFDNRFVKVYWYQPEKHGKASNNASTSKQNNGDVEMQEEEPQIDTEELARKQEEAQQKYDEHKKRVEEAEKQKNELDAKMKAIEAERKKMADAIARKKGSKVESPAPSANGLEDTEQTKALKEQLAKLEAEAKSLGIDPETASVSGYETYPSYPPRGRGGWRGRARGRGRGGCNPSFRGGWGGARGGAVMRLDNRPKTVALTFVDGTYSDHEESLRQWLLFNGSESATLMKHPGRQDAALVKFPERFLGENLMAAAHSPNFPLAGKAEMSWYTEPTNGLQEIKIDAVPETSDAPMQDEAAPSHDMDAYDVAEDDHWG